MKLNLPKITASELKVYIGVVGAVGLGVYQLTQGQVQAGLVTLAGAVAVLGIGGTVAATRSFVDPRVPTPEVDHRIDPEALQGLDPRGPVMVVKGTRPDANSVASDPLAFDSPRFQANVFREPMTGQVGFQVEAKDDAGELRYAVFFHGSEAESAYRDYLRRNEGPASPPSRRIAPTLVSLAEQRANMDGLVYSPMNQRYETPGGQDAGEYNPATDQFEARHP